jgi:hypothetical protein
MRLVLSLGRRAIDLAVLFLALYALVFVHLGQKTGLQHLQAILGTRAARDAGRDLARAAERLGQRLLGESEQPIAPRGKPAVPALPSQPRRSVSNAHAMPGAFEGPDASVVAGMN